MKLKLTKNFAYQLLFLLCVSVTYLNNYELTFAIWSLACLFTVKQKYSLKILAYTSIFCAILLIAVIGGFFKDYILYYYLRDISYLLKPVIGLLLGYQICRNEDIKPFNTIVYTGLFIAIIHIGIIFHSVFFYRITDIHKLREYGGYFSDFEIYALLVIIYSNRFELGYSKTKKNIILLIITVSVILYLSRTNFLQLLLLCMAMQGYFKINKRSLTIMTSLIVMIALLYTVLFSIKISRNGKGMEAFWYKVKNAPIEAFKSKVNKDNWQDLNDNYRSFEQIITRKQVAQEPLGPIFGKGAGSTVDLGRQMWSNDGEYIRYLPVLHNGFITIYLKAGLVGIFLYLLFLYYICKQPKTNSHLIKNINLFILGSGIFLFLSSWVLLGFYYKTENKSILLGMVICYREILLRKEKLAYQNVSIQ